MEELNNTERYKIPKITTQKEALEIIMDGLHCVYVKTRMLIRESEDYEILDKVSELMEVAKKGIKAGQPQQSAHPCNSRDFDDN